MSRRMCMSTAAGSPQMRGVVGGLGTRYASAGRVRTRAIGAALSLFAGGVYVYSIVMSKTVRGRVCD